MTHVFIKRSEATGERRHASVDTTAAFSASAGRPGEERYCVLMGLSLIASWGLSPALGPETGRLAECSWNRIRQARGYELQATVGESTRSDAEGAALLTRGDLDFIGFSGNNFPTRCVSFAA